MMQITADRTEAGIQYRVDKFVENERPYMNAKAFGLTIFWRPMFSDADQVEIVIANGTIRGGRPAPLIMTKAEFVKFAIQNRIGLRSIEFSPERRVEINLLIPKSLADLIAARAKHKGLTVNQYCVGVFEAILVDQ